MPLSLPTKLAGLGALPVTVSVKFTAVLVPPLSLITCLITVSCAAWSSFVTVHVFDSPNAMVPEHPTPRVFA